MGIGQHYSREVRTNLQNFPVWEPGTATAPGEVGELVKGVFIRQATLDNLEIPVSVKRLLIPGDRVFQSANSFSSKVTGTGGKAKMKIEFSREGAVIFYAHEIWEARIDNLQKVRMQVENMKRNGKWKDNHVFVSSVFEAKHLGVLVSSGTKAWVELQGDASMLQQFQIGEIGVTIGESSSLGYKTQTSGPALLRMYGFGWLTNNSKVFQFGPKGQNAPPILGEILPNDPTHDE